MILNPNHIIKVKYIPEKLLDYIFVPETYTKSFFGKVKKKDAYFVENTECFPVYLSFEDISRYSFLVRDNKLYSKAEIVITHTTGESRRSYSSNAIALAEYNGLKNQLKNYNFIKF